MHPKRDDPFTPFLKAVIGTELALLLTGVFSLTGFTLAKVAQSLGTASTDSSTNRLVGVNFFSAGAASAAGAVEGGMLVVSAIVYYIFGGENVNRAIEAIQIPISDKFGRYGRIRLEDDSIDL